MEIPDIITRHLSAILNDLPTTLKVLAVLRHHAGLFRKQPRVGFSPTGGAVRSFRLRLRKKGVSEEEIERRTLERFGGGPLRHPRTTPEEDHVAAVMLANAVAQTSHTTGVTFTIPKEKQKLPWMPVTIEGEQWMLVRADLATFESIREIHGEAMAKPDKPAPPPKTPTKKPGPKPSLVKDPEFALEAPKPKEAPDPRHAAITAQIKDRFREATGGEYAWNARDAAELKRFLAGWKGKLDEFWVTAVAAWKYSTDQFSRHCRVSRSLTELCRNWPAITAEIAAFNARVSAVPTREQWSAFIAALTPKMHFADADAAFESAAARNWSGITDWRAYARSAHTRCIAMAARRGMPVQTPGSVEPLR